MTTFEIITIILLSSILFLGFGIIREVLYAMRDITDITAHIKKINIMHIMK